MTRFTLFALLLAACGPTAAMPPTPTAVIPVLASTPAAPPTMSGVVPPSDAPPICPPQQQAPQPQLVSTRSAMVPIVSARDDSWRRPVLVPGTFLRDFQPSSQPYNDMICHDVYVFHGGNAEGRVTSALGTLPKPLGPPKIGPQLWLMGWHLVSLESHPRGVLIATVEQRPGFEGAWFDLRAALERPDAGAIEFAFVDKSGATVLSPITTMFRSTSEVYGQP